MRVAMNYRSLFLAAVAIVAIAATAQAQRIPVYGRSIRPPAMSYWPGNGGDSSGSGNPPSPAPSGSPNGNSGSSNNGGSGGPNGNGGGNGSPEGPDQSLAQEAVEKANLAWLGLTGHEQGLSNLYALEHENEIPWLRTSGAASDDLGRAEDAANAQLPDPAYEQTRDSELQRQSQLEARGNSERKGDPVGVSTGELVLNAPDESLTIAGITIRLSRTYHSLDSRSSVFGRGWSWSLGSCVYFGQALDSTYRTDPRPEYSKATRILSADVENLTGMLDDNRTAQEMAVSLRTTLSAYRSDLQEAYDSAGNIQSSSLRGTTRDKIRPLLKQAIDDVARVETTITALDSMINDQTRMRKLLNDELNKAARVKARLRQRAVDVLLSQIEQSRSDGTETRNGLEIGHLDPRIVALIDEQGNERLYRIPVEDAVLPDVVNAVSSPASGSVAWSEMFPHGVTLEPIGDGKDRITIRSDGTVDRETPDFRIYRYSFTGMLESVTDENGNGLRIKYGPHQIPEALVGTFGRRISIESASRRITEMTDPVGADFRFSYSKEGMLDTVTDPVGDVIRYGYSDGRLDRITKPDGSFRAYKYENVGERWVVIGTVDEEGYQDTYSYDFPDRLTTYTNASGVVERYQFDSEGRTIRRRHSDGTEFDISYDAQGNISSTTDEAGTRTQYARDQCGRVTGVRFADGSSISIERDASGHVIRYDARNGATSSWTRDKDENVTTARLADGSNMAVQYNTAGLPVNIEDARGETEFRYGPFGYITTETFPDGSAKRTIRDALGRIISSTDELGDTTRYQYRLDGLLTKIINPDGTVRDFRYNSRKDLTSVTDERGGRTTAAYDHRHLPERVTRPAGDFTQFSYRADGKVVAVERGALGAPPVSVVRYSYGNRGWLNKQIGPVHQERKTYERDALGHVVAVTDGRGDTTKFSYDTFGQLISREDAAGNKWVKHYDSGGRLIETIAPNGATVEYSYDPVGRIASVTNALGNESRREYDAAGDLVSVTTPRGGVWRMTYDPRGNMLSIVNPLGAERRFTYSPRGNLLSAQDENGNVTTYVYDKMGRPVRRRNADGSVARFLRDEAGNIVQVRNELGSVTQYAYDADNRLVRKKSAMGAITSVAYDELGNRARVTDPRGAVTTRAFDADGRITAFENASGVTQTFTYDPAGNRTSEKDGDGNRTVFKYDAVNRLVERDDPIGVATRFAYDRVGNMVAKIASDGTTVTYEYDALGNPVRETNELGLSRSLSYDAHGNIARRVDYAGNVTKYQYGPADRLIRVLYPDGTSRSFKYDPTGNLVSARNASIDYTFTYDEENRLLTSGTAGSGTLESYSYDASGSRTEVQAADGSFETRYQYDRDGRLVGLTDSQLGRFGFRYDSAGNELAVTMPNGSVESYTYDPAGRMSAWSVRGGDLPSSVIAGKAFVFDAGGRKQYEVDQTGRLSRFSYDPDGRLRQVDTSPSTGMEILSRQRLKSVGIDVPLQAPGAFDGRAIQTLELSSPDQERIKQALRGLAGGREVIPTIQPPLWSEVFKYDTRGNRTELSDPEGTIEYQYGPSNRLLSAGNRTFFYDDRGDLIQSSDGKSRKEYQYNFENRLTGFRETTAAPEVDVEYDYGPLGRRIGETVENDGSHSLAYRYVGTGLDLTESEPRADVASGQQKITVVTQPAVVSSNTRSVGKINSPGRYRPSPAGAPPRSQPLLSIDRPRQATSKLSPEEAARVYVGDARDISSLVTRAGVPRAGRTRILRANGRVIAMLDGADKYYISSDEKGTPVLIQLADGATVERVQYDAFGGIIPQSTQSEFAYQLPVAYTGKLMDPYTGSYNYGYREYSPEYGRFTSSDPVEDGDNWYAYVADDPINNVDPYGLQMLPIQGKYLMQRGPWAWRTVGNGTALIAKQGCAVVLMADVLASAVGDNSVTPETVNDEKRNFAGADIRFGNVASAYGLEYNYWTRDINHHLEDVEASPNKFYVGAEVRYDTAGDTHFVGLQSRVRINGEQYARITGTSLHDTDKRSRPRSSWKISDDGSVYVKVSDIVKILSFKVENSGTQGTEEKCAQ